MYCKKSLSKVCVQCHMVHCLQSCYTAHRQKLGLFSCPSAREEMRVVIWWVHEETLVSVTDMIVMKGETDPVF